MKWQQHSDCVAARDSAASAQAHDGPEEPERVWAQEPQQSGGDPEGHQRPEDPLAR